MAFLLKIWNIINFGLYIYVLIEFIRTVYPKHYDIYFNNLKNQIISFLGSCVYSFIYFYSRIQLIHAQIHLAIQMITTDPCILYIKNYFNKDEKNENNEIIIEILKEGIEIDNCIINDFGLVKNNKYDLVVCSYGLNKLIFHTLPECFNYIGNSTYEITDFCFIQTNINFRNGETIQIDFKNEKYNYYIVNNIFNRVFILYFLKTYYQTFINKFSNEYILDYNISIIDQNANMITLDNTKTIQIQKTNYIIIDEMEKNDIKKKSKNETNDLIKNDIPDILFQAYERKITDSLLFYKQNEDYIEL